jgi:predicted transcriptional regulator of viral defense system
VDPAKASVDPYLVDTALAPDSTVAYHAALQFWGKAYSQWQRFHYTTESSSRGFRFRQLEFRPVSVPRALRGSGDEWIGVTEERHAGGKVRVTTLERALVDVLAVPKNAGDWEEIWRSLEMVEFFDLDAVISYALRLGSALMIARLGFFLEQHSEQLMVEEAHLEALRRHRPRQPRYLDASREPGRLTRWNLVVPEWILERSWAEVT